MAKKKNRVGDTIVGLQITEHVRYVQPAEQSFGEALSREEMVVKDVGYEFKRGVCRVIKQTAQRFYIQSPGEGKERGSLIFDCRKYLEHGELNVKRERVWCFLDEEEIWKRRLMEAVMKKADEDFKLAKMKREAFRAFYIKNRE